MTRNKEAGQHRQGIDLNRRQLLLAGAGLASLPFAGSALAQGAKPAANTQAELDALIKAARAEGEVTLYTSTPDTAGTRIVNAFSAKYGVKAGFVRLSGVPLRQRYGAEAQAGNIAADLMFVAGAAEVYAEDSVKKGWMESISQAGLPVIRSGEYPAKYNRGPSAVVQVTPWLIGYNTEKLKGPDVPKDWKDVLNPKLKGQIIIPDPKASDAYLDVWALLIDTYGASFLTQIRALGPRYVSSGGPGIQALGAGEASIMFPTTSANVMTVKAKGAPLELLAPDKTTGVEMQVMLTQRSKAKHPNAARLLANWVLTPEGNKVFNDEPGGVTVYDPKGLPKQYEAPKLSAQGRRAEIFALLGLS